MINNLTIDNFQSHEHSELEFDSGVNVIVGDTDSGKSAIIRALRWIIYNEPLGDDFRSNWGGQTSVEIKVGKNSITRIKDNNNLYILNDNPSLKGFGSDVPDSIKEVLNMDEVNLQEQHDSIFLINNTAGEVAKHFNKIAKIDKIDIASKNLSSEYQRTKQTISIQREDLVEKETELNSYKYLEEAEQLLSVLENLEIEVTNIKLKRKGVKELIFDLIEVEEQLYEIPELRYENEIDYLLDLYAENESIIFSIGALNLHIEQIETIELELSQEKYLDKLNTIVNDILSFFSESEETTKKSKQIKNLIQSIDQLENAEKNALKSLEKLENKFEEHMIVCPLCNTKLK